MEHKEPRGIDLYIILHCNALNYILMVRDAGNLEYGIYLFIC